MTFKYVSKCFVFDPSFRRRRRVTCQQKIAIVYGKFSNVSYVIHYVFYLKYRRMILRANFAKIVELITLPGFHVNSSREFPRAAASVYDVLGSEWFGSYVCKAHVELVRSSTRLNSNV